MQISFYHWYGYTERRFCNGFQEFQEFGKERDVSFPLRKLDFLEFFSKCHYLESYIRFRNLPRSFVRWRQKTRITNFVGCRGLDVSTVRHSLLVRHWEMRKTPRRCAMTKQPSNVVSPARNERRDSLMKTIASQTWLIRHVSEMTL